MPTMTIHPITICGEPVLHTRAQPVTDFDAELAKLLDAEGSGSSGPSGSTGPAGDGPAQDDGDDSPQDGPAKG